MNDKKISRLMVPAIFGFSIAQIGTLSDRLLASFLADGSISFLYYANRLLQFPLGIFGIALTIAIFPTLSRQAAQGEKGELVKLNWKPGIQVTCVAVPLSIALAIV